MCRRHESIVQRERPRAATGNRLTANPHRKRLRCGEWEVAAGTRNCLAIWSWRALDHPAGVVRSPDICCGAIARHGLEVQARFEGLREFGGEALTAVSSMRKLPIAFTANREKPSQIGSNQLIVKASQTHDFCLECSFSRFSRSIPNAVRGK